MPNRVADAGAPIVVDRGDGRYVIVSGNGRVLSLRQVYGDETMTWKANQYRDRLGAAADGYRRPVLVQVITDQLSHDELVKFAERANRNRIAEMSITEKAQRNADSAGIDLMMLYQGGEFTKKENQPFLRAFMRKVATAQELGEMSKNGVLTKPGVDRLNAAVLAAAYDDTGVLSLMLESTDNNIKSISSAYRDAAPAFMKLRAEIAQGLVREEMDITPFMMEAARFVQEARDSGVKIVNALAQTDAFSNMDPVVDRLIRQFYNPQLTRANSSLRIGEVLQLYAEAAREKRLGGFFEDSTTPLDVIDVAERKAAPDATDETLFAPLDADAGARAGGAGEEIPQPAPGAARVEPEDAGASGGPQASDRPAAEAASGLRGLDEAALRARLAEMKLPDIRKALADEGIEAKGRSKEQLINSAVEGAKKPAAAATEAPASFTHEQNLFRGAWNETVDGLELLVYGTSPEAERAGLPPEVPAAERRRDSFTGKAQVVFDRLIQNYKDIIEAYKVGDAETARAALADAGDNARQLDSLSDTPAARLFTQHARSAERKHMMPAAEAAVEAPPAPAMHPHREAFYDFLEGDRPVKDARTLAKALGIDHGAAFALLDEGVENGWLKQKDNSTYIRTPKNKRPVRPGGLDDVPSFMGSVEPELIPFKSQLDEFLDGVGSGVFIGPNKKWELLLKNNTQKIEGVVAKTLTIESIDVGNKGAGTFKQLLEIMEASASAKGMDAIYVQNVLTERFAEFFRRAGWVEEPAKLHDSLPSFFKRLDAPSAMVDAPKGWGSIEPEFTVMERNLQTGLAIQRAIGKALHRVPDVIRFEVMDRIGAMREGGTAAGMYSPREHLIRLSKEMSKHPDEVANHEIFHALRHLKLFTEFEWNIIRNAYENAPGVPENVKTNYRAYWVEEARKIGVGETDPRIVDKLIEEWAATDHGEWSKKRASERDTPLGMLHQRVKDFLSDLRASFENLARRAVGMEEKFTATEIFRAIEDGSIAQRWQEWGMGRNDGTNPLSAKSMAIDEQTKRMNDDMRALAEDKSEKLGRLREEALKALAPCAAYNL